MKCVVENSDVTEGDLSWDHIKKIFGNDYWGLDITHPQSHKSWRPLTTASFALNRVLYGLDPKSFHIVNVALHSFVSLLVVLVARNVFRTGRNDNGKEKGIGEESLKFAVLSCGVLFALHPMHTEAVSNITNRSELLSLAFQLLAFLAFCQSLNDSRLVVASLWILVTCALSMCAALCKETGIAVLGICVVWDFITSGVLEYMGNKLVFATNKTKSKGKITKSKGGNNDATTLKQPKWGQVILRTTCIVAFLVLFMKVRLQVQGGVAPDWYAPTNVALAADGFASRALTIAYLDWFHFKLLLLPFEFCPDWRNCVPVVQDTADPRAWMAIAFFCFLSWRAYQCLIKKLNTESMGWALLVFPFLPAANLFFYVGFTVAERVTYSPSVGFCVLASLLLSLIYKKNGLLGTGVLVAISAVYFNQTVQRDYEWGNELRLWSGAVQTCPGNFVSHVLLGNVHEKDGNIDKALECFQESLKHNSAYLIAHLNIGRILRDRKEYAKAATSLKSALMSCDTEQVCGIVHNGLGLVYTDMQDWHQSASHHNQACALQPHNEAWRHQRDYAVHMSQQEPVSEQTRVTETTNQKPKKQKKKNSKANEVKQKEKHSVSTSKPQDTHTKVYDKDLAKSLAMKGNEALKNGQVQEALGLFQKSVEADNTVADVHRQMAYIYSEMNEHLSAASSLLSAYKAEGERNVDTFITHCVYLARGGEIEDGIAKLRDTIDKWPERRIRISYEIGTVYRDIGSKDKAKDIYNEILEVQSESNEDKAYLAKTLVNLGVFFYENRDIPSAIQHFETALKHDPGHEHARKNLQALRGNK
eukprot:m.195315 g.195315  ORF g.195315 m.195315 type:complete len:815 (+) comp15688_c0_seq8:75-2519(+)